MNKLIKVSKVSKHLNECTLQVYSICHIILFPNFFRKHTYWQQQYDLFIPNKLLHYNTHALTNFSLLKAASLGSIASNMWWTWELREFRWLSTSLHTSSNRSVISCRQAALSYSDSRWFPTGDDTAIGLPLPCCDFSTSGDFSWGIKLIQSYSR